MDEKPLILPEDHPFSLILPLVEEGKIDPWSVDIEALTKIYLEEIKKIELLDMRVPAKVVSAASFLLRKKVEVLFPKPPRTYQRNVSLKDIIKEFEEESLEEPLKEPNIEKQKIVRKHYEKKSLKKAKRVIPIHKSILPEVIRSLQELFKALPKKEISYSEIKSKDIYIQQFIALMFLNYDNLIEINQDMPFGDIKIKIL